MSDTTESALVPISAADLEKAGFGEISMAPGLAVFFNDALYQRCKQLAQLLSQAEGVIPRHLIGKPAACFAVISRAITWNLDPVAVMGATYQTPNGSIGYEGKLVSAILENSGRLDGNIRYELVGEWDKVRGKFKIETSQKGNKYPAQAWKPEDEEGLGVMVSARVKGEKEDRVERYMLNSFYPRNSTLWALRPEQQIKYAACRAFANTAMPGILFGIPFEVGLDDLEPMRDVTPPRPERNEFTRQPKPEQTKPPETAADSGEVGGQPDGTLTHEQGEQPEPQQAEEQAQAEPEKPTFELAKARLLNCARVSEVADLRKEVSAWLDRELHGEWEKLCDARTNKLVDAMSRPAARAKR